MNWKRFLRTASVALLIAGVWIASGIDFHWREKTTHADAFAIQNGFVNVGASVLDRITFTPSANGSVRVYSISGTCGGAGGGTGQLMILDLNASPQIVWASGASEVGVALSAFYWPTPFQGLPGHSIMLKMNEAACGGTADTLNYQVSVN